MTMKARKVDISVKQLTMADEINSEEGGNLSSEGIFWSQFCENFVDK